MLSSASVDGLQTVPSNSSYERTAKWKTFRFQRGLIVCTCLAGASVNKTATSVSTAAVSKVMLAYTNQGKTSSAKNCGRKPQLSERDCQTLMTKVSKNYRTTVAKVKAELNIYLEDQVSNETVWRELHKSNIQSRDVIAKPLITENKAKRWTDDVMVIKPWCLKIGNMLHGHVVPNIRLGLCLENAQESL